MNEYQKDGLKVSCHIESVLEHVQLLILYFKDDKIP